MRLELSNQLTYEPTYEFLIVVFVAKVCSTKKLREPNREDLERKKELLRILGHLI